MRILNVMTMKLNNLRAGVNLNEVIAAFAIAALAGLSYFGLYGLHDESLILHSDDVWFDGDMPRIYGNMVDRNSIGHFRVKVHPLYSLETYPPVAALSRLHIDRYQAVRIVSASLVSIWFLSLYALLRIMGCVRTDAVLFSLLGLSSAASIVWMAVPETYLLGSISIISCLFVAAYSRHANAPDWAYVAVSSFSLSVTVTNFMVGILVSLFGDARRRILGITLVALSIVTLLWGVEKFLFPSAVFFIGDKEEASYLYAPTVDRIIAVVNAFVFHTVTFPSIDIAGHNRDNWPLLTVQTALPGSAGALGALATVAWTALLAFGVWSLFTVKTLFPLKAVLVLSLVGQLALHVLYGQETFLYSLHFLPLLITLVAFGSLTTSRAPVMALTAMALPLILLNNWLQFKEAQALAISPRNEMRKSIALRPHDPWPRGDGHVVLAIPGSKDLEKSYHEPGGGFSPGVGTFGISMWFHDQQGKLAATSDSIDINQITQRFQWEQAQALPEIITTHAYYDAAWKNLGVGSWQLNLRVPQSGAFLPSLLFRSVGPSGGAVRHIAWDGKNLLINKRWVIVIKPTPTSVHLGEEGSWDWMQVMSERQDVTSQSGWAFARVELEGGRMWSATVQDTQGSDDPWYDLPSARTPIRSELQIAVPDERFAQSLDAQISHLMMGIVKQETRPGDPTSYLSAWQRDGVYVLVALVRAGKLDVARTLAKDIARRDFFGGVGPEADAPGLGIWALMATAEQIQQADFYKWVWPHIKRKATVIEKMLNAQSAVYESAVGPIAPGHGNDPDLMLVAESAREGLIVGKMDHHRPLLFINAISYRGLVDAAKLARRLGHSQDADRWDNVAKNLKAAWERSFRPPLSDNDRTYISALWPSWVATDMREALQEQLGKRWAEKHAANDQFNIRPLWTYFEVAEAHQWLFLGNHEKTWSTLKWFWKNQNSPGLYTWWKGDDEDNSIGAWENVRGWVNPRGVTPHYWTAAEMALLQMDMLGYVEESPLPVLVVGNGVPVEWTKQDMNIKGLKINGLDVDWRWHNGTMTISVKGTKEIAVRLGAGFPDGARCRNDISGFVTGDRPYHVNLPELSSASALSRCFLYGLRVCTTGHRASEVRRQWIVGHVERLLMVN
ncbi:MAG: hypothetical protein IPK92_15640 [Nitrospira sp.]|nr:hypothetical protein [Nitrospira sp.]